MEILHVKAMYLFATHYILFDDFILKTIYLKVTSIKKKTDDVYQKEFTFFFYLFSFQVTKSIYVINVFHIKYLSKILLIEKACSLAYFVFKIQRIICVVKSILYINDNILSCVILNCSQRKYMPFQMD